jgi:hypothetical protein
MEVNSDSKTQDRMSETNEIQLENPADLMDLALREASLGGSSIRITDDIPRQISVYDLISVMCDCDIKESRKKMERIMESNVTLKKVNLRSHQFAGRGQKLTPVATASVCMSIIQALPRGYTRADQFKALCNKIAVRYAGGDVSLASEVKDIDEKFESGEIPENHPLQAFRSEVIAERSVEKGNETRRQRLEDDELEAKINAMRANNKKIEAEVAKMRIDGLISTIEILKPEEGADERAKIIYNDRVNELRRLIYNQQIIANSILENAPGPQLAIESAHAPRQEITFQTIGPPAGYPLGWCTKHAVAIGKAAVANYRVAKGGISPPKHNQYINGRLCSVNTYFEEDADLLLEAMRSVASKFPVPAAEAN